MWCGMHRGIRRLNASGVDFCLQQAREELESVRAYVDSIVHNKVTKAFSKEDFPTLGCPMIDILGMSAA